VKATRLAVILTVGFAVGGICYLPVRHYESAATIRGYSFEPPNPCRPKWLAGATTNALPSDDSMQQKLEAQKLKLDIARALNQGGPIAFADCIKVHRIKPVRRPRPD